MVGRSRRDHICSAEREGFRRLRGYSVWQDHSSAAAKSLSIGTRTIVPKRWYVPIHCGPKPRPRSRGQLTCATRPSRFQRPKPYTCPRSTQSRKCTVFDRVAGMALVIARGASTNKPIFAAAPHVLALAAAKKQSQATPVHRH
jgi:hypothetical protein